MGGPLPVFTSESKVDRRAQQIRDPIQRLKYLRQATSSPLARSRRHWTVVASLAVATLIVPLGTHALSRKPAAHKKVAASSRYPDSELPAVWPVEQNNQYDLYSNGLRIENALAVSNQPREYSLISHGSDTLGPRRSQPAGIVFHITESDQAPFESSQTTKLKRIGKELLLYVRQKRAYHFVIDRFGRVNRIVVESDAANHAGNSVWADDQWVYLELNASFIGIAFEARTQPGEEPVNAPQLHSARALTQMLRAKYNIPAANCVTHAQVSVNPSNMHIGWHTDWGTAFPFSEVGLPDNYQLPNPALYLFGFEYDPAYENSTGPSLWKGLALAEERRLANAAQRGLKETEYRKSLQQSYRKLRSAIQDRNAEEEN
jgi:hypothetical protein